MFVLLKPIDQRKDSATEVIGQIRRTLGDLPGTKLFLQAAQDITVGGRQMARSINTR